MAIWLNPEFGPRWLVSRSGDRRVLCAHRREDAEAYERGEISAEDLRNRNNAVEEMAKLPQTVLDFERGMADYRRGLRRCPFTVTSRVEPWLDGWKTAQGMRRR